MDVLWQLPACVDGYTTSHTRSSVRQEMSFWHHLLTRNDHLPRQARNEHEQNSGKRCLSQAVSSSGLLDLSVGGVAALAENSALDTDDPSLLLYHDAVLARHGAVLHPQM
jgi:hypothetical protein